MIPSHANEVATKDGVVIAGSKTDIFIRASRVPVHVPLSEQVMTFNAYGDCIDGCAR